MESVRQPRSSYLKKGAKIILQARNLEKLQAAAQEIDPSGERVSYYSTDLTDQEAVEASANKIIEEQGLPDVVINSAGAGEWLSFKEASVSHYKETMDSPYLATALTCKVFYDKMQERGKGHFIIINSAACYFSFPGATGYTPARWAMLGFANSLQADLARTDFKVSMIALGKVDSPYFANNPISEERIPRIVDWIHPHYVCGDFRQDYSQNGAHPEENRHKAYYDGSFGFFESTISRPFQVDHAGDRL